MGLDQFAYRSVKQIPDGYEPVEGHRGRWRDSDGNDVIMPEVGPAKGLLLEEIAYWRKHPNLEGFMAKEWKSLSRGQEGEFNCEYLPITAELLDRLETGVEHKGLPETHGFFFGDNSSEAYYEEDLKFIADARAALADGAKVFYYSWW